ncbi:PREDICTED: epoxide hydrolase 2-like [Rhagoletis zephyria]|uniref:epoxide hydrolase 2-like n=1 Tax=Rhagoletis zephyria TaxID=28612 RepID=UPI00081136BF|nr:PREDICTED: epoxide hydrolase 2-like [Rhagoletis zephyria]
MRGYGESDKPKGIANYAYPLLVADLVELVESLVSGKKQNKIVLVAHDWGGVLAWTLAQTRPDLVDRFIVMNAPHPDAWVERIATSWKQFFASWYMFFFNVPCLAEISLRSGDFKVFDVLFGKYSKNAPEETAVYKHYFSLPNGTTAPLNYYRARLRGYGQVPESSTTTPSVQPKTLILWGRNDTALIEVLAADSARYCARSTVHYIEDCSHWIQLEKPAEVNKLMAEFLQEK